MCDGQRVYVVEEEERRGSVGGGNYKGWRVSQQCTKGKWVGQKARGDAAMKEGRLAFGGSELEMHTKMAGPDVRYACSESLGSRWLGSLPIDRCELTALVHL